MGGAPMAVEGWKVVCSAGCSEVGGCRLFLALPLLNDELDSDGI